ncbi:MAG: 4-(cytidine 5'-diphospho)-2-C-methyl-D-erythritol kinase [Rhizobiales bacterium]|nr:4-(cytidine 5'-diphospho)-2-C-methyl-D-erythritol kinase [Hyphomicrobiales bacterium]
MLEAAFLPSELVESAPAKVNLTLRVLGRRADGYHDIESLVAFAGVGDRLALTPGEALTLVVVGPSAAQTGTEADNLVTKAARALAARVPGLRAGAFRLEKNLPVAAGLGGGSADAAAALRLLAQANRLAPDDPRLRDAARATGADVPVCLDPRPRLMRGIGEILSAPLPLPRLSAVLVNPGVAVPTKLVFSGWKPSANQRRASQAAADFAVSPKMQGEQLLDWLARQANDLEAPAIALAPAIAEVLASLRVAAGCRLARMSGSGATCFALFSSVGETASAGKSLRAKFPDWWISETVLG